VTTLSRARPAYNCQRYVDEEAGIGLLERKGRAEVVKTVLAAIVGMLCSLQAMADRYGLNEDYSESSPFTQAILLMLLGVVVYAIWNNKK